MKWTAPGAGACRKPGDGDCQACHGWMAPGWRLGCQAFSMAVTTYWPSIFSALKRDELTRARPLSMLASLDLAQHGHGGMLSRRWGHA